MTLSPDSWDCEFTGSLNSRKKRPQLLRWGKCVTDLISFVGCSISVTISYCE